MFPGQTSMWQMTAAQRMLLLGPPKATAEGKPAIQPKPEVRRLTMDEMRAMSAKNEQRELDRLLRQAAKESENGTPTAGG